MSNLSVPGAVVDLAIVKSEAWGEYLVPKNLDLELADNFPKIPHRDWQVLIQQLFGANNDRDCS